MLFELDLLIPFILLGLFLDVFIFHHFRENGDAIDTRGGTLKFYFECCLCHGFCIGIILYAFFATSILDYTMYAIPHGMVISIVSMTYNIMVLKEHDV